MVPPGGRTLGAEHEVMSRGIRRYVERIIETIKDRLRVFNKCFPCRHSKPEHVYVSNFFHLYGQFYNHTWAHQSLVEHQVVGKTEFGRPFNLLKGG